MKLHPLTAAGFFSLKKEQVLPFLLLAAYLIFAVFYLRNYFIADVNSWLGLILAPYLLLIRKGDYSFRYLLPTLICLGLAAFIPITTLVYLTLIFAVLLALESTFGKVSYYILFLLLILSTVFQYFSNFFGFPIRLWLSKIAGQLLLQMGQEVVVSGNLIRLNGTDFSVDPACAGLRMMAASFILALFVLAFYQRRTGKQVSFKTVAGMLALTLVLNIGANLIRIVLLVLFKIPPVSYFHDLVGMGCLVVYVVLPLLYLAGKFFKNPTLPVAKEPNDLPAPKLNLMLNGLLLLTIMVVGLRTAAIKASDMQQENNLVLPGYQKQQMATNITKFENSNYLIYVKPVHFYSAEHSPMICWSGSGYSFQAIRKEVIAGKEIYTGILKNGADKLYTAWWFDRGLCKTSSQLEWRWEAAGTDQLFNLINISATSPEALQTKTREMLTTPLFQ